MDKSDPPEDTAARTENHAGSSDEPPKSTWTPNPVLKARAVLPDQIGFTNPQTLKDGMVGRESDPGSMSIYLCLLDERPHLHPSLGALHKHRLQVHSIALPPNPVSDLPVPSQPTGVNLGAEEWLAWKFTPEEEARRKAFLPLS